MKLQLLYQKVYFKSTEWKELLSFIHSIEPNISISLLSKNTFFIPLKQIKQNFIGECILLDFELTSFDSLFDLINKIQHKYAARLFLIGFLTNFNNVVYFLKINQLKNYYSFFNYKKNNITNTTINSFLLYELLKHIKLNEVSYSLRLSFFKKNFSFYSNFNYYY